MKRVDKILDKAWKKCALLQSGMLCKKCLNDAICEITKPPKERKRHVSKRKRGRTAHVQHE